MENNSCIIYNDFLPPDINAALCAHTIQHAVFFSQTKIWEDGSRQINEYWRNSATLPPVHFAEFSKILVEKIKTELQRVIEKLDIKPFETGRFEIQLTSHNHGEFYKPHVDNGGGTALSRMITFVYYFHSIPKMFTGGQLLFMHNKPKPLIVEPDNNTIVFFDASLMHAVHPVTCPSKQFEHGRFTLNGWVRKKVETDEVKAKC